MWFATAVSAVCGQSPSTSQSELGPGLGTENIPVSFTTSEGWVYDGRIELPSQAGRNGWAVMMLGGGLGSPIDWEVPGVMTLDGNPTRDADAIAKALLDAGFVVMRWQAIRRGDPLRAKDPMMIDAPTYAQTVEQAHKAWAAFREKNVVPDQRIFLLGHSLGARRAGALLERNPRFAGLIALAGASLMTSAPSDATGEITSAASVEFETRDANRDRFLTRDELPGKEGDAFESVFIAAELRLYDEDKDGRLNRHEWIALTLSQRIGEWYREHQGLVDKEGHRPVVDVLIERNTPILYVVGSLDETWLRHSYKVTVRLRRARHPDYTWRVYDNLGHELGPEVAGEVTYQDHGVIAQSRTGPIDSRVVQEMVAWLKARAK